jgi:hypothetical protein
MVQCPIEECREDFTHLLHSRRFAAAAQPVVHDLQLDAGLGDVVVSQGLQELVKHLAAVDLSGLRRKYITRWLVWHGRGVLFWPGNSGSAC